MNVVGSIDGLQRVLRTQRDIVVNGRRTHKYGDAGTTQYLNNFTTAASLLTRINVAVRKKQTHASWRSLHTHGL